jgi:predicted nucleic acid-binding protein
VPIVVADTGPLNYLVLIRDIDVLPQLFKTVLAPQAVFAELGHVEAPARVKAWIDTPPPWLELRTLAATAPQLSRSGTILDAGEAEALALAADLRADLVLMDDRAGVAVARAEGFTVMGTLGILDLAARHRLIDLAAAFARLKATSFRCRPEIMDAVLARHTKAR